MEAPDVIRLAGLAAPTTSEVIGFNFEKDQAAELERLQKEEIEWRQGRETELERYVLSHSLIELITYEVLGFVDVELREEERFMFLLLMFR